MAAVRTRIAPSPTGYLHVGTARTALFNYLFAKKYGGSFVIRIEDTDLQRSEKKFEAEILESLEWLGITADESPIRGGEYGPYRQSERQRTYVPYLERLLAEGKAFYCQHSEAELEAERETLMATSKNPVHSCQYRDDGARDGIIRFKTPAGRTLAFTDFIRGGISFASDLLGDFSIAKNLETPLYNFAVVIDDHEMKISHVIRGEDHISNTPKQLLIQKALGLPQPAYAHLPLILGPDRAKLSKRHGATSIGEFREQGYLADALVNFMALLGWNPGGDREIFKMSELIEHFDMAKVQKAGAVFDRAKLNWMNGEYIRRKPREELVPIAREYLPGFSAEETERALILEQSRIQTLGELHQHVGYLKVEPNYPPELLRWKQMTGDGIRQSLERAARLVGRIPDENFTTGALQEAFLNEIKGGDKGELLWPLRVALTGRSASPGPFEVMAVLGREQTLRRLHAAVARAS